jgi:hypothetical protein
MIALQRIRQQPAKGRVFLELLINAPALFLMLYGLKCMLTLRATIPVAVRGEYHTHFRLASVTGQTSVVAGLGFLGFGLFIYLSDGPPLAENCGWPWRIGRALLRWSGLLAAICAFLTTNTSGYEPIALPAELPAIFIAKIITMIGGTIALISFLRAMFSREQVKKSLSAMGCTPLHIWWRPCAYWLPYTRFYTGFRVIYLDAAGITHRTYCVVSPALFSNAFPGTWRVRWIGSDSGRPELVN